MPRLCAASEDKAGAVEAFRMSQLDPSFHRAWERRLLLDAFIGYGVREPDLRPFLDGRQLREAFADYAAALGDIVMEGAQFYCPFPLPGPVAEPRVAEGPFR